MSSLKHRNSSGTPASQRNQSIPGRILLKKRYRTSVLLAPGASVQELWRASVAAADDHQVMRKMMTFASKLKIPNSLSFSATSRRHSRLQFAERMQVTWLLSIVERLPPHEPELLIQDESDSIVPEQLISE